MLWKITWREIRNSFGRYIAIFAIIALGTGFFNGLKVTKPAMLETLQQYQSKQKMFDFQVMSTLGLTEEDVTALAGLDGVSAAEGSCSTDVLAEGKNGEMVLKVHTITENVNIPCLTAGRMPEKDNECLADSNCFSEEDIGRTIRIADSNSQETLDSFRYREYTVVGLMRSVTYINFERGGTSLGNGVVSGFLYIPYGGFSTELYSEIYLTLENTGYVYSREYDEAVDAFQPVLEEFAEERADIRYQSLTEEAGEEIQKGKQEIADGRAELEEARAQAEEELSEAAETLSESRRQLDQGWSEYYTSRNEFASTREEGQTQLTQMKTELDVTEQTLQQQEEEYLRLQAQIEQLQAAYDGGAAARQQAQEEYEALAAACAQAEQDYNDFAALYGDSSDPAIQAELEARKTALSEQKTALAAYGTALAEKEAELNRLAETLQQSRAGLTAMRSALDAGWEEYNTYLQQYEDAQDQLQAAQDQLDAACRTLQAGEEEYEAGLAEYETARADAEQELADAEQELTEAEQELADAEKELSQIPYPTVYCLGRDSNVGYVCFNSDSDIVENIAYVFPLFFFLVAALVCITTMTRMVDEQRTQIGTLKALGYGDGYIMSKFLLYSGSAALLGCTAGYFGGSFILPRMIWQAYNIMYGFDQIVPVLDWPVGVLSVAAFLLCAMLATWQSCRSELRSVPAELIRPKSPKAGRRILLERIPLLWNRLGFLIKVSLRNMFRYKKRLLMMIVGVGGCTALLLTGFGINDSISHVVDFQYDEVMLYDGTLRLDHELSSGEEQEFLEKYPEIAGMKQVWECTLDISSGNVTKSVNYIAADMENMDLYFSFHSGQEEVPVPGDGECLLNEALAENLNVSAGDTVTLRGSNMTVGEVTVAGVYDNYIYNYVIVNEATNRQLQLAREKTTAFVHFTDDCDQHAAAAGLMGDDRTVSVTVNNDMRERVGNMMSSLNYIVLMVTICAGALAFIVIYNLTNISVNERIREIATLKVLGFYPMETEAYVFRENMLMTAMGALAGLGAGILLHAFVMHQIKIDMISFDVRIAPVSFVYAVALTFAFALVVAVFMYFKLQKINMTESLKSIE